MSERKPDQDPAAALRAWLMEPMRATADLLKVALAAVFINIFGLITSLFTMTVYDRVVPNNATSSLVALSIGLAIVVIFDFILKLLRAYFVDIAGASIDRRSARPCSSGCSRSGSSSRRARPAR
jgi:ATP-binding cassette subfamily C protein LapB